MDKNFVIAIVLSTLIIVIYASPMYQRRFGKEIPKKPLPVTKADSLKTADTAGKGTASPPPSKEPEPALPEKNIEPAAPEPAPSGIHQVNAPSTETDVVIRNEDMLLTVSARGGAIRSLVLTEFNGSDPHEPVQLVKEGESWYDGSIRLEDGSVVRFDDIVFTPVETSGDRAVFCAEFNGNRAITREYRLERRGYIIKAKTNLEGEWGDSVLNLAWHGPINETEIPYKALKIWPFSMFMRDDRLSFQKIVYLGDGTRFTVINGNEKTKRGGKRVFPKEDHSQRVDAKKPGEGRDRFTGEIYWYAVRNKYFMSVAIPREQARWKAEAEYRFDGAAKWFDFTLEKKLSDGVTDLDIYAGPMKYDVLKSYGRDLTEAMELSFRFIRPLSIAFLWLFNKLHTFIPNWGLVIIVFSLIIKVVLYPLSKTSYVSMRKMSALQPQINALREKYKNNPQMLHKATMELYKKEGVNPFSGCLPTLLQLPVFLALYPVVGRAFELRQAMFVPHWIEDLSRPDPYYILPVAMGISMFLQSKTTMKDPQQKPMLYIMPVMMVILFANFGAGLTLYWFLFNIMSFMQQKIHRT